MINVNRQTLGGRVVAVASGRDPLPWLHIKIQTLAMVWDRNGKRASVKTFEHVVIQGEINTKTYRPLLKEGAAIYVVGQRVPAYTVANDNGPRGIVLLAEIFHLQGEEP